MANCFAPEDIESIRKWYGIPGHIPEEQIDRYIEVLYEKDVCNYLGGI